MKNMNASEQVVAGRNPVTEALRSGRGIEKILVADGAGGSIKQIIALACDRRIPIHYVKKVALDRAAGGEAHQGVVAYVSYAPEATLDDILDLAAARQEDPFVVLLDGMEDPHNLGAIIRSAECAGAHGVVLPKRHAAGITETVSRTSAGAVEYIPCARVGNLTQAIDQLKARGLWVAACDMGGTTLFHADLKGPLAIVVGGEGTGVGKLVRAHCDFAVSIPMKGRMTSLNASNAAAVLMYEVVRQRDGKQL